ncbi:MAG: putative DNA binding domain-containing protein [Chloroflexi bacterium]|nr:putative DNA binding domain-containing protein [Chloroflexota bacterium]MCI0580044.1 putative DNA binding domain-containing protein [Chloroflexota bacterium]MCI0649764.1 putative DNA binding domain-containing protein [Chloroflexota bacterium]MCI0730211.1 putative DNA binding domain-containing protein [Chloroflexota bacterium]
MDLHLHTAASNDYQEPHISYLDILRQAEVRGLDIIAFADHNTVAGYAAMQKEIEQLTLLERLNRLEHNEKRRLDEYRRLLNEILVLPGFEFTATFGFHILGIFSPETPVAYLEHLLLTLNVPLALLPEGSSTVGATADVLTAYRVINQAGGLVIAAHANSGNGVVMRGLDFGGQTKIAYTQDPNLHCLEVTDLEKRGRYTTRRFFEGSKPEYPRAMRCIQGSDAHRLMRESLQSKYLGVGDRVTEILLDEVSFEALAEVLKGNDFSLTRPYRGPAQPLDFVQVAREEGPSLVQSFHKSLAERGGYLNQILEDVCAMANTNGGTIYIGVPLNPKEKIVGVREPKRSIEYLEKAIDRRLSPVPEVHIDSLVSQGQTVVRVNVLAGRDVPYAIDDNRFYVREEAETTTAVRDEIVRLVERRLMGEVTSLVKEPPEPAGPPPSTARPAVEEPGPPRARVSAGTPTPPRTGVEIVSSEERDGTIYHAVRDLRNGSLIKNVTKSSARKLWHYAISQAEAGTPALDRINWHGNMALIEERRRDNYVWYDLAMRDEEGVHVYYGVTDSGLNEEWLELVQAQSQS